ncbi:carboxypeptidase regulatory-like domain-containing protein [Halorientalis brevis]|uniref:Carboxypeptidase regulatory-like domain-containing protein n=1 Tax=Halorientalis brevis TaxID=1126241 RepID=A0ABD6CE44_9EURY
MDLSEREARSRDELICPNCRTEGLERYPAFARQKDDPREKIIHGTKCPECETRVDPEEVEKQLADPEWSIGSLSLSMPSILAKVSRRTIAVGLAVVVFLAAFLWIPLMAGPIFGGSEATEQNTSTPTIITEQGNWTVYEGPNGFYVTNGDQSLTPDGLSDEQYNYGSKDIALSVLDAYLEYLDTQTNSPSAGDDPSTDSFSWTPDQDFETPSDSTETSSSSPTTPEYSFGGGGGGGSSSPPQETSGPEGASSSLPPLHGTVLDSQGNPVGNAAVIISDLGRSTTTAANGTYRFSEDLPSGTHRIYAKTGTVATSAIEFTVTSDGAVTVSNSPTQALFVKDEGDTLSRNRLSLLTQSSYRIDASGRGTYLSTNISFAQPENAAGTNVTLSPVYTGTLTNQVFTGPFEMLPINGGNTDPETQALGMSGVQDQEKRTIAGTIENSGTRTLDIDGNMKPAWANLTLSADVSQKQHTTSDTWRDYYGDIQVDNVGGNIKPTAEITLTGKDSRAEEMFDKNVFSESPGRKCKNPKDSLYYDLDSGRYEVDFDVYAGSSLEGWGAWATGTVEIHYDGKTISEYLSDEAYNHQWNSTSHTIDVERDGYIRFEGEGYTCEGGKIWVGGEVTTLEPTGSVEVTANGETYNTSSLSNGETETVPLALQRGDNTVNLTLSRGDEVGYEIRYTERWGVKSPAASLGDTTLCKQAGVLKSNLTCEVSPSVLELGGNDLTFSKEGGNLDYAFTYGARAKPTAGTITINGQDYSWATDFSGSQFIPTNESQVEPIPISSLHTGTNNISISQPPTVDGLSPSIKANLSYDATPLRTANPEITVIAPSGATYNKSLSETSLTNGLLYENATIELPVDWFEAGEHEIRIKTGDRSLISADLNATGLTQQVTQFQEKESAE